MAVAVRLGAYGVPRPEVARPLWQQVGVQAEVWLHYRQLWLLPVNQSILHDHPDTLSLATPLLLAVWGAAGWLAWRRGGTVLLALSLWVLPLLPASLIPLKETMAEHRTYLSGLGLCMGLVLLLPEWKPGSWVWRLAWTLPLFLALATVHREETWRTEVQLWSDAVAKNRESAEAWYGLGDALRMEQRWGEANDAYHEALSRKPDYIDARINLGITLAQQSRLSDAEATWKEVLRQAPRNCAAHNDLGSLALQRQQWLEAMSDYQSTLSWCPDDPIANLALGDLFYEHGDSKKAIWHYRHYLDAEPDGPAVKRVQQRLRLMAL
jgi:tetratricopeptide (TPR) repeat protein